jgi:hypothetical protein
VKLLYNVIKSRRSASSASSAPLNLRDADGLGRTENRLTDIIRRDYPEIETYIDKVRKEQKPKLNIKINPDWFNDMKPE